MKSTILSNICGFVFIAGWIFDIYIEISKKRKNNNEKNKSQEVNNDHLHK